MYDRHFSRYRNQEVVILEIGVSQGGSLQMWKNYVIDILIDDGGHSMEQQIVSYEEFFPHIKENGVYLCEDLHTSYWSHYRGGHKRRGTFIEYSKNFIDFLNAYHSKQRSLRVNEFTKSADSIHYYDSVIVIEKKKRDQPPHAEQTGKRLFSRLYEPTNANVVAKKLKKASYTE